MLTEHAELGLVQHVSINICCSFAVKFIFVEGSKSSENSYLYCNRKKTCTKTTH